MSGLWLGFRKMFRTTLIFFGIILAESLVEDIAFQTGLLGEHAYATIGKIVSLACPVVCRMYGNAWYLAHTKREIVRIRARGLSDDAYYEALSRCGRTSLVAALGLTFLFAAMFFIADAFAAVVFELE